jgi:predicted enzyme related to lactoylglutathione lyase
MAIKRIDLAWITVSDIKKAQKFFVDTLGLGQENFTPEHNWLEVKGKLGGMGLGVGATADAESEHFTMKPGQNAVVTFTVDDIVKTMKELQAKGVKFIDEIMEVPGHVKMVSFVDSDNNMFQLVEDISGQSQEQCC